MRIWNLQGYHRNSIQNFLGLIQNKAEFPSATKKSNAEFQRSWFLALEFLRDLTEFCENSRGGALLFLDFSGSKVKKIKNFRRGGVKKVCPRNLSPPPIIFFFWNRVGSPSTIVAYRPLLKY